MKTKSVFVFGLAISFFLGLTLALKPLFKKVLEEDYVVFSFVGTIMEDDQFQVYYLLPNEDSFSGTKSVIKDVKGSNLPQKVSFELPLEQIRKLRFDIGTNVNQKSLQFFDVEIARYDHFESFSFSEFLATFKPNGYIEVDTSNSMISTRLRKDLWSDYDPFFTSSDLNQTFSELLLLQPPNSKIYILISGLLSITLLLFLLLQGKNHFTTELIPEKYYHNLLIILFLLFISVPLVFFGRNNEISSEDNTENKRPDFELNKIEDFTNQFDSYFNKNFGFRDALINGLSRIKINIFQESSVPDKVILGKNGWMFLWGDFYNIKQDFLHSNLHSKEELKAVFDAWDQRREILNQNQIGHFITFFPNKHTIYPEMLPFRVRIQQPKGPSRAEQILNYYQEKQSPLKILNITSLLKNKKNQQIYFKHDSHWNNLGAFWGYQALIDFIRNDYPEVNAPKNLEDYEITSKNETGGGLVKVLGVENDDEFKEQKPYFTPRTLYNIESKKLSGYQGRADVDINHDASNDLTLLIFRDSYFTALRPFVSTHFRKVIYIWSGYEQKVVDLVEPNIVLEANVERYFSGYVVK